MDWTSVFDESGEEELIIPQLMEGHPTQPRLERLLKKIYVQENGLNEMRDHRLMEISEIHANSTASSYSLKSLYYLTINYILGVGCLGIPYAFARAGFLLCCAILLTVTVFSYMTVMWVAETGERYEIQKRNASKEKSPSETSSLLTYDGTQQNRDTFVERYEVVDLVSHYLGPVHTFIYQASLVFLMFVGLLAYTQVFCGSISALLWSETDAPKGLSQVIFGVMVIPLSCMELDEQVSIQSLMAKARFLAIFVMVAGSLVALFVDDSEDRLGGIPLSGRAPFFASPEIDGCHMSYTACFPGFGVAFSTVLFSQLFQHSVPGLLRPLSEQSHLVGKAPQVFGASLLTTCAFYLLLGTSAASYFGANTKSSVNLNFANFNFGFDPETTSAWVVRLARVASTIVVVFPALDTISVFPLIANTLGNNMYAASNPSFLKWIAHQMASIQGAALDKHRRKRYSDLGLDDRKVLLQSASQVSTIFWRLVAAIPPLIGSIWATDLSFSFLLAGVAGIYVAFVAPCLLQLNSRAIVEHASLFRGWYSCSAWTYPVIVFACFALYEVVAQIGDAWTTMRH
jgi:amino acid permease